VRMDDVQVLVLKCYGCTTPCIDTRMWAKNFLLDLVNHIGMTPLVNANWEYRLTHPDDPTLSGISASRGMAESDVSVHTWPEVSEVLVCIKSCGAFDEDNAMSWVAATLGSQSVVRA